jgi:DNA-binding HxlR family transcriptional regulator
VVVEEGMKRKTQRSGCPINLTMEVLGDAWSMIVLRDIMFGDRRHFRELYKSSEEGIATNILTNRLNHLVDAGLLTRHQDPTHKQRTIYNLTEASIELIPLMSALGEWGLRWLPASEELSARARVLAEGGPVIWEQFMDELRCEHLGTELQDADRQSVRELLDRTHGDAAKTNRTIESDLP